MIVIGAECRSKQQKTEIKILFKSISGYGTLDYVACWYIKALEMIYGSKNKFAFVSTKSIVQGEQSSILWKFLNNNFNPIIFFAHKPFKWSNNAQKKAAVHCVIIGICEKNCNKKTIYSFNKDIFNSIEVKYINNYLLALPNIFISKRTKSISNFPQMIEGITPLDNGILSFNESEYLQFITKEPQSKKWFKKWITGNSFIKGITLYCLWLSDFDIKKINNYPLIKNKIEKVTLFRKNSKSSQKFANTPWLFRETTIEANYLLIPKTSSEKRIYIPVGYINDAITSSSSLILNNSEPYIMGIITSKIHMTWMRTVAGRLKTDYRYSSTLVYNTFPFPKITTQQKDNITQCVFRILEEREKHSEKTLAQLYDPDKMPESLREAHHLNDLAIEQCYRNQAFNSDEERLEYLFKLYEEMIEAEKNDNNKK